MVKRRSALKIFVDSSVFFTAVNSPVGGSAKIFSLSYKKFYLFTSLVVLAEVERNVRKKLTDQALERFFHLTKKVEILLQKPDKKLIAKANKVIVKKDAVILAEAKKAKTDFLLTLDKKHFFTKKVKDFIKPYKVINPKDLLKKLKRLHRLVEFDIVYKM